MRGQPTRQTTAHMKIAPEIVNRLSIGLYRNFGLTVKELVSNAYDADATEVKIRLDLENKQFIIRDNGYGMTEKEVRGVYLYVGGGTKPGTKTPQGRIRIGQFGIGNLGVFPYCEEIHLITKKQDTNNLVEVKINAKEFTKEFIKGGKTSIERIPIPIETFKTDLPRDVGETVIYLNKIKPHIIDELQRKGKSGKRTSIDQESGYRKFEWTLRQYLSLQYPKSHRNLIDLFKGKKTESFRVWLDGKELFRNVVKNVRILNSGEEAFGNVRVKYAIMSPMKPVRPEEARGLQLRLRNVAIGFPTDFDVIKLKGRVLGKLNYITGEIHILTGLESDLLIDRDRFSYTKEYDELAHFFREKLTAWNSELETIARDDKQIYIAISGIPLEQKVIKDMKVKGILSVDISRVRIPTPKEPKGDKGIFPKYARIIVRVLEETTEYKTELKTEEISSTTPPIHIDKKAKVITVFASPEEPEETITVLGQGFTVSYDTWDMDKTLQSICKIEGKRRVSYNTGHPIFESSLDEDLVKYLALGGLLLLKEHPQNEKLFQLFYKLINDLPRS